MSRRVLITGAGGFVGSHLARGFAELGDEVVAHDRQFDAATAGRLEGIERVAGSLTATGLQPLGRFDLVVHGAAITTAPDQLAMTGAGHIRANLDLLLECLDFAASSRSGTFVFLSSSGVFADDDGEDVLVETTPASGTSPYAVAKRAGEIIAGSAAAGELMAISVRLGPVYGPFERPRHTRMQVSLVRRWLDAARRGEAIVVATPEARRDWTYAPDLPRALDALLRRGADLTGVVHLTAADFVTDRQLADTIAAMVEGAEVRVERSGDMVRVPMRSDRIDLPALIDWTPLAGGLRQILA